MIGKPSLITNFLNRSVWAGWGTGPLRKIGKSLRTLSILIATVAPLALGVGASDGFTVSSVPPPAAESIMFEPAPSVTAVYKSAFVRWKRACSVVVQMGEDALY